MSEVDFKMINKRDYEQWDRILENSRHGSIFHTIDWMNILEKNYNVKKLPIGIYNDSHLVGVFPTFLSNKKPFKLIMSPLQRCATPYGGYILTENISLEEVMEKYDTFIRENFNPSYIDIKFSYGIIINNDSLRMLKYNAEKRNTYLLNIARSENEIWKNFGDKCRNSIKKAERNNIHIIEDEIKEDYIDEYYKMVIDSWGKSKQPPVLKKQMYRDILSEFIKKGKAKFLLAGYNNSVVAGAIFLCFGKKLYYFDGASYRKYYKISPNNLIQWHIIKWANKNGFELYDFVGAQVPGIAKFKASFGGELSSYLYIYKGSKIAMLARNLYEKYYKWKEGI